MSKKNNKKSYKGTKYPKGITKNPSGTYRVRKMINGEVFDKSIATLKDAKAVNKSFNM